MTEHFVMNLSPSLSESLQLSSFPPSLLLLMLFWCAFIFFKKSPADMLCLE